MPAGPCRLEYRFTKTGDLAGTGELWVDGRAAARREIGPTLGVHISPAGLTVGHAPVSEVSPDFERPFRFTGAIAKVTITLGNDRGTSGPTSITAVND